MGSPRLDRWIPDPAIRTHHRRPSLSEPDELWRAALEVRLSDTIALGRLIRWRIPGTPPGQPFGELFRSYPFTVLEEREGLLVSGLCGRIWTLTRDYPVLDPEAFERWNEQGTVRVLFAHWVEASDEGGAELVSEARVGPVDSGARRRVRALWAAIGPFERLVSSEALSAAVVRAERAEARPPDAPARDRRARSRHR